MRYRGGACAACILVALAGSTSAAAVPRVVGLGVCTPGPTCFYGPISAAYPSYGSVARAPCGDCTFAAAAHWQQIVLGKRPEPTLIGYEFAQAGGTLAAGLSTDAFFGYWQQNGIAGVPLIGLHAYRTDKADVQKYVRTYKALLAEFRLQTGNTFGQYTATAGTQMAVVDGFTPKGPLVVSWGQTLQLTWKQWSTEVVGMWGLSSASRSKPGPGVALTPPGTSASYQIEACWTQYSGGSWSAVKSSAATTSFAGADVVARGPLNFWAVVTLEDLPRRRSPERSYP